LVKVLARDHAFAFVFFFYPFGYFCPSPDMVKFVFTRMRNGLVTGAKNTEILVLAGSQLVTPMQ